MQCACCGSQYEPSPFYIVSNCTRIPLVELIDANRTYFTEYSALFEFGTNGDGIKECKIDTHRSYCRNEYFLEMDNAQCRYSTQQCE